MRQFLGLLGVLLLVAACAGESASSTVAGGDQEPTTQPQQTDNGSDTTEPAPDNEPDASEGSGPSTATVTLGSETYNFSTEGAIVAQCMTDFFGVFSVQLPMVDGGEGGVAVVALQEGTDPAEVGTDNSVEVSVGDEDWVADAASDMFDQFDVLEPGMSQVDSIEIDGRTVRGTATFFRQNSVFAGEVETMTGSFEATCGEERTS